MLTFKIDQAAFDSLDETIKAEYKDGGDGNFTLDLGLPAGHEIADTTNLKTALSKERTNAENAKKSLKAFDGIDVKEAKAALAKKSEYLNFDKDKQVEALITDTKTQMAAQHKTEVDKLTGLNEKTEVQLKNVLVKNAAIEALQKEGGNISLLLTHVENKCRMTNRDDKYIVEVIGDDGHVRLGDNQGSAMTIPQLVAEMKGQDDFAAAFTGSGQSGSNSDDGHRTKNRASGNAKVVNASDTRGVNNSLQDIADGKVKVEMKQ